jgi:hypothetical protein
MAEKDANLKAAAAKKVDLKLAPPKELPPSPPSDLRQRKRRLDQDEITRRSEEDANDDERCEFVRTIAERMKESKWRAVVVGGLIEKLGNVFAPRLSLFDSLHAYQRAVDAVLGIAQEHGASEDMLGEMSNVARATISSASSSSKPPQGATKGRRPTKRDKKEERREKR